MLMLTNMEFYMLNKPFILTLLLTLISFCLFVVLTIIALAFGLKGGSWIFNSSALGAAIFLAEIYTNKFKMEIPKIHKIKIAFYYFDIQIILSCLLVILVQNNINMLNALTIQSLITTLKASLITNIINALAIYYFLGRFSKLKLQQLEKNTLLKVQMMANPVYAESVIVNALTSKETALADVRYCQYCSAEFSANETICPICEKLND